MLLDWMRTPRRDRDRDPVPVTRDAGATRHVPLNLRLARARAAFEPIHYDSRGQKGNRTFGYASLAAMYKATTAALTHHGVLLWTPCEPVTGQDGQPTGGYYVRAVAENTTKAPSADAYETKTAAIYVDLGTAPDPKDLGAILTYFTRYCVRQLLAVAAEEDLDAAGFDPEFQSSGQAHATEPAPTHNDSDDSRHQPSTPDPDELRAHVLSVEHDRPGTLKDGSPCTIYTVTFSDGETAASVHDDVTAALDSAARTQKPVAATLKRAGGWTVVESVDFLDDDGEA